MQILNNPLQVISDLAGETIQEIRNITYNLRPQYLDQLGLTAAIETVVEKVSETSVVKFHMHTDQIDKKFSNANKIKFYRIVQLKVYDMLGREVASLVSTNQEAGGYSITFDAGNLAGGIYIARLKAGSFVKSIKMQLIK